MRRYEPQQIESKWQQLWQESQIYAAKDLDPQREKYYYLAEFPYPSGEGIHMGHVREYAATDILARHRRMQGKNVLYPLGYDAFGLPTENFAIKHKISPQIATERNVAAISTGLHSLGLSVDWSRELRTSDPEFYRWTQWIFLQFYKAGLAYQAEIPINWCPKEKTGLANEEVINGRHERCGTVVEKKLLKQWLLKITAYADRLIEGLKQVDYPAEIAAQQVNWIGRSQGAEIDFKVGSDVITVFTTRADTLGGAMFLVLAPEHPLVEAITTPEHSQTVERYRQKIQSESDVERQEENRPKTGVATGAVAINPLTGEKMPVWIADYVLMDYGTGAIMAVPAHDQRDYEFARKFDLPVKIVIEPVTGTPQDNPEFRRSIVADNFIRHSVYAGVGPLVDSGQFDGLSGPAAKHAIVEHLYKEGQARTTTKYRLRDWVFSRQHYWGEPIPIIHCTECGAVPVPEDQLPVELPLVAHYEPTETGESPLAVMSEWVNVPCPKCKGPAKRETDTMPNWAGSSWYYMRYIDAHNDQAFADPAKLKYWLPVDTYIGSKEHTTLHLLYSRFWHQFLYDQKLVPTPEPYAQRRYQGIVLASDGRKMSKSLGNVVNPAGVIDRYGADTLRVYMMFMAPFTEDTDWSDARLAGAWRFLSRVWELAQKLPGQASAAPAETTDGVFELEVDRMTHKTLKKVQQDLEDMKFNTLVSALMQYTNFLATPQRLARVSEAQHAELAERTIRTMILMLAPLAPHISEELWHDLGETQSVHLAAWPQYDPELIKDELIEIPVQVNGKHRATITVPVEISEAELKRAAAEPESVQRYRDGHETVKTIVVPRRLVNFVVK